jgi:hypothetical protein
MFLNANAFSVLESFHSRYLTMENNYYPKLDMDNILPVDTDKVENQPGVEMNNDSTIKAASAVASESPPVPLPGAYHVAPSPTASSALQGRTLPFNLSLINSITEDHHDDDATIMVVVPIASVVQENDLFAGRIVEAAPWEDPIRPAEVMESLSNLFPKDAVWIGEKRVRIFLFVVFVVIAAIVTGLTTALIRSERDQEEGAMASFSGFNNSAARYPSPSPSSKREKEDKDKRDDNNHKSGSGNGGGSSGSGGNRA